MRFTSCMRCIIFMLMFDCHSLSTCLDSRYSDFCNRTCGQCSKGEPCNRERDTEACRSYCERGWTGTLCNKDFRIDSDNESCKKHIRECPRGCEPGCTGILRAKGFQNFALKKSAYQSSTYNYKNFNWTADKAVDGNNDGRNPGTSRTCSETTVRMGNHTWEVDIGFMVIVSQVVIYKRSDILILQNVFTMSLCEVEVYGECVDGTSSEFCNRTCGQCSNDEPCNKDTGECLRGCKPGWRGILCDIERARGTYGSRCTYTCGQCLNGNETCSATDGRCRMGCREGWQGETCKNNSFAKLTQTLSREDTAVIGGSVAGVCVGALIISIIIIAVFKQRSSRNIVTGDPETEMNETGVSREQTSPSYHNVASLCIPTTTASMDDNEHAVAQTTEAEYEQLQDRGRIESSSYCRINGTETENTIYYNEDGLNIKQA